MDRRVAITGLGLVTPVGTGREEPWDPILSGRHGFGTVRSFDTSASPVRAGAEIHDVRPQRRLRRLDPRRLGRASQLAAAAARLALDDAGLDDRRSAGEPGGAHGLRRAAGPDARLVRSSR